MEITISGKEDYSHHISSFLKENGIKKIIAFSGGSDEKLEGVEDEDLQSKFKHVAQARQERVIEDAIKKLQSFQIAILTGGTKWGVPRTASEIAKAHNIHTIGIYPWAGKKHALDSDLLDLALMVEPSYGETRWGDESPIFAKLLDGVIVYGGSAGTLIEMAHILKINEARLKDCEPVKLIVPIAGTGGVADGLPFVWAKHEVRNECMPHGRVTSGREAADLLIEKLNLDDYWKEDFS